MAEIAFHCADKLDAVLFCEMRLLHLLDHAEALEREVTVGNQRFADVIAGKLLLLEKYDAPAFLRLIAPPPWNPQARLRSQLHHK